MNLKLMYITNQPAVAAIAEKYGTDWIFVDLETLGKEERQKGMNTIKSHHTIDDVKNVKCSLTKSRLLVRINPIHNGTKKEIDAVIENGADIIMLPMWKSVNDVKTFIEFVDGRCKTMLLLEKKEAYEILDNVLKLKGIDSIHIGLNDLHLSFGLTFMFELLSNGVVEDICNKIKPTGIPYGFGGIAKIGEGMLPAEKIVMEHFRLGSTQAILSRSFCNVELCKNLAEVDDTFKANTQKLHNFEAYATSATKEIYNQNKYEVAVRVKKVVKTLKEKQK